MTHPNSKVEIEVEAESVATYASQGWQTSPHAAPPPEPPAAVVETAPVAEKSGKKK
jgi:hypothetical protein